MILTKDIIGICLPQRSPENPLKLAGLRDGMMDLEREVLVLKRPCLPLGPI